MKTNFFRFSMFAMVATAMLAACSQDEVMEAPFNEEQNALTIFASDQGYDSEDPATRVANNEAATVFEVGDQMGLYVVEGDNVTLRNIPLTYTAEGKWDAGRTIYYYKNSDYIAYFPYNASLKSDIKGTEVETKIKEAGDAILTANKTTQTKAAYDKADLMMAKIDAATLAADGNATKALNFSLKHQYAMVEIQVPVHKFTYPITDEEGSATRAFQISMVDFKVSLTEGTGSAAVVSPYEISTGVYRMLITPGDFKIEGSFTDPKDQRPVEFNNTSNTTKSLEAGKYVHYNVSYTGAPAANPIALTKDQMIGYYYYKNTDTNEGVIWPNDFVLPTASNLNCLGIIFDKVGDEITSNTAQWTHYVMSLGAETGKNNQWAGDDVTLWEIEDYPYVEENKEAYDDKSGYESTQKLLGSVGETESLETKYPTLNFIINKFVSSKANNNCGDISLPSSTSGYFMPSGGQFVAFYDNIGQPITKLNKETMGADPKTYSNAEQTAFERINAAITQPNSPLGEKFVEIDSNNLDSSYAITTLLKKSDGTKKNVLPFRVQDRTAETDSRCWFHVDKTYKEKLLIRPAFAF